MDYLIALLLGLASSLGAVLLPGMLNLSVANCSLDTGRRAALRYAAGVTVIYLVQASLAIIGANYLRSNPDIVSLLSWWAIPVLFFLAAFFLVKWYRELRSEKSMDDQRADAHTDRPFLDGISVSLVNFLAIPYYFALGSWLMAEGALDTAVAAKALFVVGGAAGAMGILSGYAVGAKWIDAHAHYVTRHVHLIIGAVFVILAGVQAFRMAGQ